jgi:hypothetical protein
MRILIILLFFSSSIFAQIEEENPDADLSKFLLVGAFETKLVSLAMNQRINKSILMIASKQRDYSLLLSSVRPKDVTATTYEIKLLLKPQGKLFRIEVQLVNVNSGKIFRRVRKEDIQKANLVFAIEKALALLFNFKSEARVPNKRPRKVVDNSAIDFKKRIMNLKQDVQNRIAEKNAQKGSGLNLANSIKNEADGSSGESKYEQSYAAGIFYRQAVINSKDVVEVKNSFNSINLEVLGRRDYLNFLLIDAEFHFGKIISTTELDFPSNMLIGFMPGFFLPRPYISVSSGVSYEVFYFANVTSFGEGFEVANNKVIWWDIQPKISIPLARFNLVSFVRFSSSLSVSTGYTNLKDRTNIVADKFQIGLGIEKLLQLVNFSLKFERINLASSGDQNVSADSSNYSFHFQYLF